MRFIAIVITIFILKPASFSAGGFRTFTNKEGKTVVAEIVWFNKNTKKITLLKKDSLREISVSESLFSEEDQAFIKEWIHAQSFLSKSELRINLSKKKGKPSSTHGIEAGEMKFKEYTANLEFVSYPAITYIIEIENRSSKPFENLSISYCAFIEKKSVKVNIPDVMRKITGASDTFSIAPKNKYHFKTKAINTFQYVISGTTSYQSSNGTVLTDSCIRKYFDDDVMGICFRLQMLTESGAKYIREITIPDRMPKDCIWEFESPLSPSE